MMIQITATRVLDATIGAGDLAVEKAKTLAGNVREFGAKDFWTQRQKQWTKSFNKLASRGAGVRRSIARSAPAKQAVVQTGQAKRQMKAAATSIRKAVGADVAATRSAAKQVG